MTRGGARTTKGVMLQPKSRGVQGGKPLPRGKGDQTGKNVQRGLRENHGNTLGMCTLGKVFLDLGGRRGTSVKGGGQKT